MAIWFVIFWLTFPIVLVALAVILFPITIPLLVIDQLLRRRALRHRGHRVGLDKDSFLLVVLGAPMLVWSAGLSALFAPIGFVGLLLFFLTAVPLWALTVITGIFGLIRFRYSTERMSGDRPHTYRINSKKAESRHAEKKSRHAEKKSRPSRFARAIAAIETKTEKMQADADRINAERKAKKN